MSQATTWSVPLVGPATPTLLTQRTDDSLDALLSGHSGSARPSYAVAGTVWEDTSVAGTVKFYFFDGSDDILLCTVNTSTNIVTWANATSAATQSYGQCRLSLSGGNLLLSRFNGQLLTINGVHYSIPSAGVTLAPTGLTPSTLYYIYAWMNSGTMTLEASTTASAVDSTTGVRIKTGDATRTLVGMARPVTGPAFVDTLAQRFVRSWYNDTGVALFNNFTANRQRTSTTFAEVNTEIRCEFLVWSDEVADAVATGNAINGAAGDGTRSALAFGTTTPASTVEVNGAVSLMGSSDIVPFSARSMKTGLTEGYNYVTLFGAIQTGPSTSTWYGDQDGRRTSISVAVRR
ncbi:hypothetical protein FHX06_003684 [Rhizobium sp. BK512]|uniref:hypothetical protein n=1 Tax=Rhizobium sp. BK512 TaxID=2587010 RepID=UPI001621E173|nr:hypothetical protein [Rhizobium sp. BK512]MBB3562353.1 hypothetical protein [Rhizobium sp. BK512]